MSKTNKENDEVKELKEKLFLTKKNAYLRMTDDDVEKCNTFCEGYKNFLDKAKTEREAVSFVKREAEERGFELFDKNKKLSLIHI